MKEAHQKQTKKIGLPPGTLLHVGAHRTTEVKISVIDYNATEFLQNEYDSIDDCIAFRNKKDTVSWINIDGVHNIDHIEKIGQHFGLHPLLLEDILNTNHRPKIQEFDNCVFITLKMIGIDPIGDTIVTEQISFVLGDTWVISFQEQEGDIFTILRERLRENKGTTRQQGIDYLLYRFIDIVVDNYFYVTDYFSEKTEFLEEKVLQDSDRNILKSIQQLKKQLIQFRKSVSPLRDVVSALQKDYPKHIKERTQRYLHDVYEHIIQINEHTETQREMLASIMDLYLSGVSNKMNQIIKVLTVISTIFIPLTFIVGVYGMNFDMPEFKWKYGYLSVWCLMIIIIIGMIIYFKRKKWL